MPIREQGGNGAANRMAHDMHRRVAEAFMRCVSNVSGLVRKRNSRLRDLGVFAIAKQGRSKGHVPAEVADNLSYVERPDEAVNEHDGRLNVRTHLCPQ